MLVFHSAELIYLAAMENFIFDSVALTPKGFTLPPPLSPVKIQNVTAPRSPFVAYNPAVLPPPRTTPVRRLMVVNVPRIQHHGTTILLMKLSARNQGVPNVFDAQFENKWGGNASVECARGDQVQLFG